jgi:hypothetical protein
MTASEATVNRRVGRPRVNINPEEVGQLRGQGVSWRKIAKALKIGTTTAMRLFKSISGGDRNNNDMPPRTPEPIEQEVGPAQSCHEQPLVLRIKMRKCPRKSPGQETTINSK